MTKNKKCDVCKNKVDKIYVRASPLAPISYGYCKRCLNKNYEPYWSIVTHYAMLELFYEDLNDKDKEFVDNNISFHNKSKNEFNDDIQKEIKEHEKYYNQN